MGNVVYYSSLSFSLIISDYLSCCLCAEKRSETGDTDSGHSSPLQEDGLGSPLVVGRSSLASSANGSVSSDSSNEDGSVIDHETTASTSSLITAPTSWKPFVSCSTTSRATEQIGMNTGSSSLLTDAFDHLSFGPLTNWSSNDLSPSENSYSSYSDSFFTQPRNPSPPSSLWSYNEPDIWGRPNPPSGSNGIGYIGRPQYPVGGSQRQPSYRSTPSGNNHCNNSFTSRAPNSYGLPLLPARGNNEDRVQNILRFYAIFLDNLHPKTDVAKLVQVFSKYGTIRAVDIKPVLGITSTYACIEYNDHESPERAVTDALNDAIPKMDLVFDLKMPLVVKFTPSADQRRNLSSGSLAWNWAKTMIEKSGECFEWRFNSSCSAGRHCYRTHVVKHRCVDTLKSFSL